MTAQAQAQQALDNATKALRHARATAAQTTLALARAELVESQAELAEAQAKLAFYAIAMPSMVTIAQYEVGAASEGVDRADENLAQLTA